MMDRLLGLFHGVYYLRSLAPGAVYLTVAALLLTGERPYFVEPPALLGMASLARLGGIDQSVQSALLPGSTA